MAFSAAAYTVNEAAGSATITTQLSSASSQIITVDYNSQDITARSNSDYVPVSNTLTFMPGQTALTFTVTITNDLLSNEPDETLRLTLSNPVNAFLGTPNPAILTIVDDDGVPSVDFSAAAYVAGEAVGLATITTTLSKPSVQTVTVDYASADITATAGVDYAPAAGALTFIPGQTSLTFTVAITNDILANEFNEDVRLALSNPSGATLGANTPAILTIADDDGQPGIRFGSPTYNIAENAGPANVAVTLDAPSAITVTVAYSSTDVTAVAGDDYIAVSNVLTFTPAQTALTFTVTILDDALDEPDELARLALGAPVNAALGTPSTATLTILDDDVEAGSCAGFYPPGEPNIGLANGTWWQIGCGVGVVVDLGATPLTADGNPDYDFVYYEGVGVPALPPPDIIYLDVVTISVGASPAGPWYPVFIWGDAISDTNTNLVGNVPPVPSYPDKGPAPFASGGSDNEPVAWPPLVGTSPYTTGVQIDIDTPPTGAPPAGVYRYLHIFAPPVGVGSDDGPEVDAIEVLP